MVTMNSGLGDMDADSKRISEMFMASLRIELLKQEIERDKKRIKSRRKEIREILKRYGRS